MSKKSDPFSSDRKHTLIQPRCPPALHIAAYLLIYGQNPPSHASSLEIMKSPHLRDPNDIARDLQRSLARMTDHEFSQLLASTLRRGAKFPPHDNQKFAESLLHPHDKAQYEAICNHCMRLHKRLEARKTRARIFVSFFLCQAAGHLQWIRSYRVEQKLKRKQKR